MTIWLKEEEERVQPRGTQRGHSSLRGCRYLILGAGRKRQTSCDDSPNCKRGSEEAVDHIIMGTRGLGGFCGLLLGSVSSEVLRLAGDQLVTLVK
jgi:hypothetical protein